MKEGSSAKVSQLPPIDDAAAGPMSVESIDGTPCRIAFDPVWHYLRLDPVPGDLELGEFYESRYRDLISAGGRAPDLARLLAGGPDAALEREWQAATIHADVLEALEEGAREGLPRRALDIGCGTGELLRVLEKGGWEAVGTEPAADIADVGRANGRHIENMTAASYLERWGAGGWAPFGGIMLLNVLEHVPDPAALLLAAAKALVSRGRIVVRVPNDFNPLQKAAQRVLGGKPWWIMVPDHVNYFDHASISGLLERTGFDVVERSADFPMELFLLMGHDYRSDPAVGQEVHRRRRRAEMALDPATRRTLGRAWAAAGIGRNAFVVARRPT